MKREPSSAGFGTRTSEGPSLVTLREGQLVDITSKAVPTMRDLLYFDDPAAHVRSAQGWVI
ncbi:hypothetical protein [Sinorhizobium psoraleae]|uniref:hypothetical protein n=1 Tax=Sinorhizobium psoraleae TaxID=520838 RepID=UPI0035E3C8E4